METLNWNEDRMGRLETLYRSGLSFSLIADAIGVSRNAAIGKARRMKLPKRVEIALCKFSSRTARDPPRRRNRSARVVRVAAPELPAVEFIPDHDYRCSIDGLDDCSCRYPLWGPRTPHPQRLYCGFPTASVVAGLPYCRHHTTLCGSLRQN
jgi:hypothetical protein